MVTEHLLVKLSDFEEMMAGQVGDDEKWNKLVKITLAVSEMDQEAFNGLAKSLDSTHTAKLDNEFS